LHKLSLPTALHESRRERRAEATLSPQGGGRVKVRPGQPGSRKVTEVRGSRIKQRRKAEREKTGGQEPGAMEAKSTERRTSGREPDTEKKEPKGTGGKDQSKIPCGKSTRCSRHTTFTITARQ
jgi:sRNA-binding protein